VRAQVREVGCFVISWSQTEIDGLAGAPARSLRRGASWRWSGRPVRLDAVAGLSGLLDGLAVGVMRNHVVARARKLVERVLLDEGVPRSGGKPLSASSQTVTLTDGPRRWVASILDVGENLLG